VPNWYGKLSLTGTKKKERILLHQLQSSEIAAMRTLKTEYTFHQAHSDS